MLGPLLDFDRQATRVPRRRAQAPAPGPLLLGHARRGVPSGHASRSGSRSSTSSVDSRKTENGLLPPDNYAGDINAAGLLAQLERQLLARPARHGGGPRRHRRAATGPPSCGEEADAVPQGDPRRGGQERAARHRAAVHPRSRCFGDERAARPADGDPAGSYYDLMVPYVLGSGRVRPGRRARGLDDRLPPQPRRPGDGDDPSHAPPGRVRRAAGGQRPLRTALQADAAPPRRPRTTRWSGSTASWPRG